MMQDVKLLVLTVFALVLGCKSEDKRKVGPALTPVVANQLKAFAPECEIRPAQGKTTTKELRLCKGRQTMMTIHLDENRHLIEIEIGLWAPIFAEAEQMIRLTLKGLVSDAAIAAISERLAATRSNPIVLDGVRVDAFHTQAPNENPRYTAVLHW